VWIASVAGGLVRSGQGSGDGGTKRSEAEAKRCAGSGYVSRAALGERSNREIPMQKWILFLAFVLDASSNFEKSTEICPIGLILNQSF